MLSKKLVRNRNNSAVGKLMHGWEGKGRTNGNDRTEREERERMDKERRECPIDSLA
jgi:hypothetical protein